MEDSFRALPLVKLPKKMEIALYLIGEALKTEKLFSHLSEVGMSDIEYEASLSAPILRVMGFKGIPDDLVGFYNDVIVKYSGKDIDSRESLVKQSVKVYMKLQKFKKRGSTV